MKWGRLELKWHKKEIKTDAIDFMNSLNARVNQLEKALKIGDEFIVDLRKGQEDAHKRLVKVEAGFKTVVEVLDKLTNK